MFCLMHCHCHSVSLASVKSRLVLVLAHLGNPGQSPEGRETDVHVYVCSQRQEDERRRHQNMEMMEARRHEDLLWRQQRQLADEDPFGGSLVCAYFSCLSHICCVTNRTR